ncbi:MAG: TAXI family TRAP transporter solute-binding subunit [Rhodobacteraceae bacterium]|nr:TAXI family TRAP transporter solute-binding subunit [Paracoccaceae bacterium]
MPRIRFLAGNLRRGLVSRATIGLIVLAAWCGLASAQSATRGDLSLVSIATGERTGVYYFAGGVICGLLNAHRWEHGIRCIAERTNGSIENLREVRSGAVTFAIAQSDWQNNAVNGTGVFQSAGRDSELRSLFSLFPEPFTVVARPDAGISTFSDLIGKRVNLGPQGSGSRATMEVVMDAMGWKDQDFSYVSELPMSELPRALCSGEVDAAVFIVAHPNLVVEEMLSLCGVILLPVQGEQIERVISGYPYYFDYQIPAGTYPGQTTSVPGFALAATLVASARTPPTIVQELVKAVFSNLDEFRAAHPAFAHLDEKQMVTSGLTAPFHEGALRYFYSHHIMPVTP